MSVSNGLKFHPVIPGRSRKKPEEAGDNTAFIASALGTIARGKRQLARDTGLGRTIAGRKQLCI